MNSRLDGFDLATRLATFGMVISSTQIRRRDGTTLDIESGIGEIITELARARAMRNSVYVIGNGGSAGVAGHAVTDFFNVAKLRAQTLHDSPLITCMANDYGYENAFARIVTQLARPGDLLIAISSSGKSANIRNAATACTAAGGSVITFSGFAPDNPLRSLGDFNVWLDSTDYGFVEIGHQFLLHNISDRFGAESRAQA